VKKADLERFRRLHATGCICCEMLGERYRGPTEIHHIVDMGYRKHSGGHQATLPLCAYHHRGVITNADHASWRQVMGPALSDGSKAFRARWGTQRELLARVNAGILKEKEKKHD